MRASGILMPVFSLPGLYGIGCLSKEAYAFVDFLKAAGQKYWQVLPVGPTGYGDSPYQSFSTFAGNPYFIDPDTLIQKGYLDKEDCACLLTSKNEEAVDYGFQYQNRFQVLHKAFEKWKETKDPSFYIFQDKNSDWLEDYALFMALKDYFGGKSFTEWEPDLRFRKPEALRSWKEKLAEPILFYEFLQYEFSAEWKALKSYANKNGILIIGDIPIYVSPDSADLWADPSLFQVDENDIPTSVAGVPPDGFSADGQLWGNPLYNWAAQKKDNFSWWIRRIRRCLELYDVVRIDHFRGFDEYFSIRSGEKTAKNGIWEKGPGMDLFRTIREKIGEVPIVAEDLGYITDTVRKLVRDTGFPNMKILEFAFDARDSSGRENYLPYNYPKNCVVYTGTHDNETLAGWLQDIRPEERKQLADYVGMENPDDQTLVDQCIRLAEGSVANTAIIPMQDWLGLDNRARINQPSTLGSNWTWRMRKADESKELAERIRNMMKTYGRLPQTK